MMQRFLCGVMVATQAAYTKTGAEESVQQTKSDPPPNPV